MNVPVDSGKECIGLAGFPALLTDAALISRSDLSLAEQHAAHEQMSLADAVVALGLVREEDSYAKLAEAGGFEVADLQRAVSSELAVPSGAGTDRAALFRGAAHGGQSHADVRHVAAVQRRG